MTYADRSRNAYLEWVKTVITIVTPSMVLLIGLQDEASLGGGYVKHVLLISIVSMAISISSGLILIKSPYYGFKMLHDTEQNGTAASQELPWHFKAASKLFEWSTPVALVSLSVFGILKYVN